MILHEVETFDRIEMEALQLERLKKVVHTVYEKVPFYREQFEKNEVSPKSFQSLKDLSRLPFTTKEDLRIHYPFGLFAVDQSELVRVHASSGTSGKPTVVGYTEKDIDMWSEIVARAISIAGGKPGELLHNAYGYGLFTGGLGLHYGSERLGMTTVPVSGGNMSRQITLIEDFNPTVICGTPSYILSLAEKLEEQGKDPRSTSIKYGVFGAEPWSDKMRKTLEAKLDIKACDIYGLSEIIGPGVAMECHESQDGLHIAEDHFLVEVINPNTLEPLPPGQEGELVFTSLTKEAFPIIRYRTGDIASISYEPCECGRTTVKMSRVKGRVDDMLIIRGVNVFPSEVEHFLLTMKEISPHYQLHLKRKGSLDSVELQVEMSEKYFHEIGGNADDEKVFLLGKQIQELMKSSCLVSMDVKVHIPKSLPRSEGKAVRVVDLREVVKKDIRT
ncbi:phenylacetate-CoA ligase [Bacillus pakistanensis]|uniref:Phenylacetate-coenzyme A ligase n=1 Tax=Rossellomorea pakistanensis TaxID=992288 RepID=A0ABS2NIW1_9BACI|nr:AMP-binding protein [Bacillus pakistanensis]MBM7587805.1 phenylacetate-CoA ligase [Bacillus pakistanensis]